MPIFVHSIVTFRAARKNGKHRTRCAPCLSFVAKIASHACGKKCGLFCATRAVRARRAASAAAPASFGLGFEFFAGLSRRVFPKTTCVSKRLPSTTFRNIQERSCSRFALSLPAVLNSVSIVYLSLAWGMHCFTGAHPFRTRPLFVGVGGISDLLRPTRPGEGSPKYCALNLGSTAQHSEFLRCYTLPS